MENQQEWDIQEYWLQELKTVFSVLESPSDNDDNDHALHSTLPVNI